MTLILTAITPDFAVMVSDRRLSTANGIVTDESGKAGVIYANDGTALYAYTGLAQLGPFIARQWIQQALMEASDGTLNETIFRFSEIAERKFANLAYRRQGITLALAGFSADVGPFMGTVSNLEAMSGSLLPHPTRDFRTRIGISPTSSPGSLSGVMVNGINQAEYVAELTDLNSLLLADRPQIAIQQKASHIIRQLADDPRTGGTVGKNVMVATLRRPPKGRFAVPSATYMPLEDSDRIYSLDVLDLRTNFGPKLALRDVQLIFEDGSLVKPKLGRNNRCHCGSGLKFKYCHGR